MNHLGTKTLETERLILRRFNKDDAQNMFDNWAGDSEVTKYLMWTAHKNTDISIGYIGSLINNYEKPDYYDWGIELKELHQVIGSIGVVSQNNTTNSVQIGYCIGRKWWNKGITSEAFTAVIKYLMDDVKVNRIEARHDPRNPHSGMVMKKCGLIYEGTLRESDWNNQGLSDAAYYGMLRKDYYIDGGKIMSSEYTSRCGVDCNECTRKAAVNCKGCVNMDKPFWGGECGVKVCCESKKLNHCGECPDFPCEMAANMGVEQGFDPKPRLDNCRKWAKKIWK